MNVQKDRQMDGRSETNIPPTTSLCEGYKKFNEIMNSNENSFYPLYILGKRRPDRFTEMSNNDCSIMAFQEYYDKIYINGENVLRIHILVPTKRIALVICIIYNTYIFVGMAIWCSVNI